jgi:hypothetical protein
MSEYVPERGYWLGPVLRPGERPFGEGFWEGRPGIDECRHEWERVTVPNGYPSNEPVVRCRICLVPRCGHADDRDPCMERRHHRTVHITLHGAFEPVGGYLRDEEEA